MKTFGAIAVATMVAAGGLALSTASASARIVCNDDGECWHTSTVYEYPAGVHLSLHDDNWKWKEGEHYGWREHEGRGYWHSGAWVGF